MQRTLIQFPIARETRQTMFMIGSQQYAIDISTRSTAQRRIPAQVISIDVMQVDPARDISYVI